MHCFLQFVPIVVFVWCVGAAAQGQVTFRTSSDVVVLDLVVTDRRNLPIVNLTKDDFQIREDGRPQAILDLSYISRSRIGAAEPDSRRPTEPWPSGAEYALDARRFVILIDDLHLIEQHLVQTRKVVEALLDSFDRRDQVAIALSGRSDIGVDFNTDPVRLREPLGKLREALGFAQDAAPLRNTMDRIVRKRFAAQTAEALIKSVQVLEKAPEVRRVVFLVSEGVDLDPSNSDDRDIAEELQRLFEISSRAGVPVYALDPRGNSGPYDAVRSASSIVGPARSASESPCQGVGSCGTVEQVVRQMRRQNNFLISLAESTGGRAGVRASGLDAMIRDFVLAAGEYYLISYRPEPLVRDGKFHSVSVTTTRRDLRVRAKTGYWAPQPTR